MSFFRISLGVLLGASLLVGMMAAARHLGFSIQSGFFAFVVVASICGGILGELHSSRALRPYWERYCMGIRWRRRYPDVPKTEIREFLNIFIDAFAFDKQKLCRFSPEDQVMDVFRAVYPPGDGMADNLELEFFASRLEKRYGIDAETLWREDITLGELFECTRT